MSIRDSQMVKATSWSLLQRVGAMVISFFTNIVLARLLTPDDFGSVGLILTFVSIADLMVDAGLGQSLIQKQKIDKNDISTVFTTNLLLSIVFFTCIFVIAPWVETYMAVPKLALYLRVEAVTIILRSLYVVHSALLNKQLNFKTLAKVSIGASLSSSFIAIVVAFCGFGIWSLIGKNIIMHLVLCYLYRTNVWVKTSFYINKISFKQLFGFGWFVSLSSLIDVLYTNLASFIIGKRYSVEQLGYYTQAHNLKQIPVYSLSMVISQVLFPMFSKEQDDTTRIKTYAQRIITIATALVFPLMLCLVVVAEPLIVFLYSTKWLLSVQYFRILCVAGLINILIHINRSILMALGQSKSLFKVQLAALCIGGVLMVVALQFDVFAFIVSIAFYSFINWLLVAIKIGQTIGYGVLQQIKSTGCSLILSTITAIISSLIMNSLSIHVTLLSLVVNVIIFMTLYVLLNIAFNTKALNIAKSIIKR